MTKTEEFNKDLSVITDQRGDHYGSPLTNFKNCAKGEEIIAACPDPVVRHALFMIWVKVCRLVETPDHMDSIVDIAGYAKTICMALDERDGKNQW